MHKSHYSVSVQRFFGNTVGFLMNLASLCFDSLFQNSGKIQYGREIHCNTSINIFLGVKESIFKMDAILKMAAFCTHFEQFLQI